MLLATIMLQVGVDVQRLGLMVVTGQPKNTAEYIQATSRVGRRSRPRPGRDHLPMGPAARPRPLRDFGHYHATFVPPVEGLTTTPVRDRALDRGLTGVLVARCGSPGIGSCPNEDAQRLRAVGPPPRPGSVLETGRAESPTTQRSRRDAQRARYRLEKWCHRRGTLTSGVSATR